jgi:site-specific DNA recombinase
MRVAFYARVSTDRQQRAQTIEQQVEQLRAYAARQPGWVVQEEHIFRDDGYSGARLDRPGLDTLRDQAAWAAFDAVLIAAPDRLARKYVHQMIVLEELERRGVRVVFIDRPPSDDPHEQLVVQIRGAVAEYERTLIADRMRRGRQAKLRSGRHLPWTRPPYGYRLDPSGRATRQACGWTRPKPRWCGTCLLGLPMRAHRFMACSGALTNSVLSRLGGTGPGTTRPCMAC